VKPYYQDKWVTIYHGDCREILPSLNVKVDLVLTDPPYGLKQDSFRVKNREKLAKTIDYGDFNWDILLDTGTIAQVIAAAKWQIVFGGNYYALPSDVCWLIWDKDNSGDFADCEMAWTNLPGAIRKITWRWNGMLRDKIYDEDKRVHPTQKPIAVMKWAITQADTKVGQVNNILDPLMGSGTSLLAAKFLNRYSIGIEIEEKYCEIAARRCSQEVMELKI
jgi:DNA modification methylase